MQRVCILLRSLAPGGAEKQALLLTQVLRHGYEPHLVLLSEEPRSPRHLAFLEEHGIEPRYLGGNGLTMALRLARILRRERIDVVLCFLPSDTVLGALVGRLVGVRRVFGGLRNSRLSPRKERVLRFVHNRLTHGTVSNSQAAADHFGSRGFDPRRFHVIRNGIEIGGPPPGPGAGSPVVVLTVGRFVPEKDHRAALVALRAVLDRGVERRDLRLVIAGSGPLEEDVRRWVDELDLADVVQVVVDPRETGSLFASADLYLSTSHYEGISNSIQEALLAGLPVVATDVGDNAFLVEEGVSGHLVPLGDAAALAERLHDLVSSPEDRAAFGAAGRALLERECSLERFRAAYVELLGEGTSGAESPSDPGRPAR